MNNPLELTPDQARVLAHALDWTEQAVADGWPLFRDMILNAVLDRIDEDRNPLAYGACGCAADVRAMKGDGR